MTCKWMWPWKRRSEGDSEATRARKEAERGLERTRAETPMYAALGESLRQRREANHLTELFLAISHRGKD